MMRTQRGLRPRFPVQTLALPLLSLALLLPGGRADAGSHLWDLSEVFSNADGTIQFIELHQPTAACCELGMNGKWVRSLATGNQFTFPANLTGNTAFTSILLGTAGFAALPGAPAVDHIIPDNFFSTAGDTIELFVYDSVNTTSFPVPLDGTSALQKDHATGVWGTGPNSPTNYAGATGNVDAGGPPPPASGEMVRGDTNADGTVTIADAIAALGYLFQGVQVDCISALDIDASGGVDIGDAIQLLGYLFSGGAAPQPPFPSCGPDPAAAGTTTCDAHAACP